MKRLEGAYGIVLVHFLGILTKLDFEDEIKFKWGRIVTPGFSDILISRRWVKTWSSDGVGLQMNMV